MLSLQCFEIYKLHGDTDIKIDFHKNKKILIAENGSGKTTAMNILYYALKNNIVELDKFNFEKCVLKFLDAKDIIFKKTELSKSTSLLNKQDQIIKLSNRRKIQDILMIFRRIADIYLNRFGFQDYEFFLLEYFTFITQNNEKSYNHKILFNLFNSNKQDLSFFISDRDINRLLDIDKNQLQQLYYVLEEELYYELDFKRRSKIGSNTTHMIYSTLKYVLFDNLEHNKKDKKILNDLNKKILFLPTYRRIENDSSDLFSEVIQLKEGSVLSFGMVDVHNLFNKISEKLQAYTRESFNNIKNNALNDLISNPQLALPMKKIVDIHYLEEVINKVGIGISPTNKIELKNKYINDQLDNYLKVLITKMCEIYDKQTRIEKDIETYTTICNKYLSNKSLIYNKNNFKIEAYKNYFHDSQSINLSKLSSGEKQIISLFAKLYLSHIPDSDLDKHVENHTPDGYWILFDEPELSLSVEWQEMLLPDIIKSNRCEFLFATTHSPFIFNNDLRFYTSHISECTHEVSQ